jgi:hypothetical protein
MSYLSGNEKILATNLTLNAPHLNANLEAKMHSTCLKIGLQIGRAFQIWRTPNLERPHPNSPENLEPNMDENLEPNMDENLEPAQTKKPDAGCSPLTVSGYRLCLIFGP